MPFNLCQPKQRLTFPADPTPTSSKMQVSSWMAPGGKLFVHIFVHATMPYHFEVRRLAGASGGSQRRGDPAGTRLAPVQRQAQPHAAEAYVF